MFFSLIDKQIEERACSVAKILIREWTKGWREDFPDAGANFTDRGAKPAC